MRISQSRYGDLIREILHADFSDALLVVGYQQGRSFSERVASLDSRIVPFTSESTTGHGGLFAAKLSTSASIVNVLIRIADAVPSDEVESVEATVLRRFWQELDGWLLHPRVCDEILSLVDLQDEGWLAVLEDKVTRYGDVLTKNDLLACHQDVSLRLSEARFPDALERAAAFLSDYLLLQQAYAIDIRRAGRIGGRYEPLGAVLRRLEATDSLVSGRVARALILGDSGR